ncbi:hypothetical protein L1887_18813 [Cichorium endivia]|nr:hypothetical protein L1887_18813 [Cichorium endivia]
MGIFFKCFLAHKTTVGKFTSDCYCRVDSVCIRNDQQVMKLLYKTQFYLIFYIKFFILHIVGTRRYMSPEYLENVLVSTKLDDLTNPLSQGYSVSGELHDLSYISEDDYARPDRLNTISVSPGLFADFSNVQTLAKAAMFKAPSMGKIFQDSDPLITRSKIFVDFFPYYRFIGSFTTE